MQTRLFGLAILGLGLLLGSEAVPGEKGTGLTVDKEKRTVTVACKVAPRKLPNLKTVYPLEVVACYPAPKGQKAHETVITFDVKPSEVHKALVSLGLKPGTPARGEVGKTTGPEVKLYLEIADDSGAKRIPIEESMVDTKSGKSPAGLKWHFTGSVMKTPDPEKDDMVYGADLTGTLITIYPVSDETVFQSSLGAKEEVKWKLETSKILPKIGTAVKLVIEAK